MYFIYPSYEEVPFQIMKLQAEARGVNKLSPNCGRCWFDMSGHNNYLVLSIS